MQGILSRHALQMQEAKDTQNWILLHVHEYKKDRVIEYGMSFVSVGDMKMIILLNQQE